MPQNRYHAEEIVTWPAWARKALCWAVLVCAVLAHYSGMQLLAGALGVAAIACFVADFRAFSRDSHIVVAAYRSEAHYFRRRLLSLAILLALAVTLFVGSELVMRLVYQAKPGVPLPSLCLICHR